MRICCDIIKGDGWPQCAFAGGCSCIGGYLKLYLKLYVKLHERLYLRLYSRLPDGATCSCIGGGGLLSLRICHAAQVSVFVRLC